MSVCTCRTASGYCVHNPAPLGKASRRGSVKRRARAIARRLNVARIVERIEDREFYENGTIPASATSASICSCGARSFARGEFDHDAMRDWDDAHAFCGEDVTA